MMSPSRPVVGLSILALVGSITLAKSPNQRTQLPRDSESTWIASPSVDSLARLDSLRRMEASRSSDSLRRVNDSLRRVDSLDRAQKTWFVARPSLSSQDTVLAASFHQRLIVALRRTGRFFVVAEADTGTSSWESSWQTARASGAGKVLLPSVRSAAGRVVVDAWVYETTNAGRFDSARIEAISSTQPAVLAHDLVSRLVPMAADSVCRFDSSLQASIPWAFDPIAHLDPADSTTMRMVKAELRDKIWRSGRASWMELARQATPQKADSAARASGVARLLRPRLFRDADSTWVLGLRLTSVGRDTLVDSVLATSREPSRLASRALADLLRAPASCQQGCGSASARAVWSLVLSSDSALDKAAKSLSPTLKSGFRARRDRQFLSLPDSLDARRLDSVAAAEGVSHLAVARLSGGDSLWVLTTAIRNLQTRATDTFVLRRGGPIRRVFPWFSRHLSAWGATAVSCADPCRRDSLRRESWRWGVVETAPSDSAPDSTARILVRAFASTRGGAEVVSAGACTAPECLDSLAQARRFDKLLWTIRWRPTDSTWAFRVRVSDVISDRMTDSVTLQGLDARPTSMARVAPGIWSRLRPPRDCDTCLARDTLEDALLVGPPSWVAVTDSQRQVFRAAMLQVFTKDRSYQVIDSAPPDEATDSAARFALMCKTGAVYRLRSQVRLEAAGWHVSASIEEIATGKVVASTDYQDKSKRPERPTELASWAAGKLLGTETGANAPEARRDLEIRKMLKLGIPAAVGILVVLLSW